MKIYTLTIAEVRQETNDAVTLAFKQPGLRKVQYQSGQYLTLIFKINGRRYMRPYSFSSAPNTDKYLEVTVKQVMGGVVSNHICDVVKVGDVVEVLEPMGEFVIPNLPEYYHHHVVLWGAGSGITPLFSIAKQILHDVSNTRHVTIVYGNRTHDSVIFKQQIEALQLAYPSRLRVWSFYTQLIVTEALPNIVQGRIDPNLVLDVLSKEHNITHSLHYICGPTGLKAAVKNTLAKLAIPSAQVFSEDFELVKNDNDFIDIITQQVCIKNAEILHDIEVVKGKSILEAGLDALIDLPYSCQTGNCSICKGKLLMGSVKQILPKHPDLADNEYQLCCTYPLTKDVVVEVVF